MSEPTVTIIGTCSATSVLCYPLLVGLGFDVPSAIWGAAGVVIVQTFIPRKEGSLSYARLAAVTFASIILASIGGPVAAQLLSTSAPTWWDSTRITSPQLKGLSGAIVGGFAQPLVIAFSRVFNNWVIAGFKRLFGVKDA